MKICYMYTEKSYDYLGSIILDALSDNNDLMYFQDDKISEIIDAGGRTITVTVMPSFLYDHICKWYVITMCLILTGTSIGKCVIQVGNKCCIPCTKYLMSSDVGIFMSPTLNRHKRIILYMVYLSARSRTWFSFITFSFVTILQLRKMSSLYMYWFMLVIWTSVWPFINRKLYILANTWRWIDIFC